MRKSRAETAATRQRIVASAEEAMRRHGLEGVSLHGLMQDVGLTHGGFYRHFRSKEALLNEACTQGFERMVEGVRTAVETTVGTPHEKGLAGLAAVADAFLSIDHRDPDLVGCPLTMSGSELARADPQTRLEATASIERVMALIAEQFASLPPAQAHAQAGTVLSIIVGAVTLARIVDDPALADRILADARRAVVASATQE